MHILYPGTTYTAAHKCIGSSYKVCFITFTHLSLVNCIYKENSKAKNKMISKIQLFFIAFCLAVCTQTVCKSHIKEEVCPGKICPHGCCEVADAVCCENNLYCAKNEEYCFDIDTSGASNSTAEEIKSVLVICLTIILSIFYF